MPAKEPKKKVSNEDKGVEVIMVPSNDLIPNRQYSNYVQVAQSPYDFTLRFCDAPPMYDPQDILDNKGVFPVPIVAEISIPFPLMPELIKTLQVQYEQHQKVLERAKSGEASEKK